MKETITIEVEKATYDLAMGAGQFVVDVVKALGDGFQPIRDVAALGTAVMTDIIPVAGNFAQLAPELKEDAVAFAEAWAQAGVQVYKKLVQK